METPIAQRAPDAIDTASYGGGYAADAVSPPPWGDATAVRLRARHWRQAPGVRRPSGVPLLLALVLHALFAAMVWQALRTTLPLSGPPNHALLARFVPIVLPERIVSPEPPATPAKPRTVTPRRTVAPPPPRRRPDAADITTTATLYDRDGQPLLPPPTSAASAATPDYVQRLPQGDAQVMRHANPLPYQPTRLDQYFPPPGESAGGAAVRKLKDAVVGTKAVDIPGGIHLKCKTLLGIPTPNCSDPPAPPSAKDGDERLSMAPAKPLAADPHPPAKPALADCIAMYREGKPLAWGCPVDTPDRAVDDELRRRAAGATQH